MERHKNALLASSRRLGKWVQSPDCNFNLVHLPLFRKKETETQREWGILSVGGRGDMGAGSPRHQTLLHLLYLGVVSTVGAGARFNYFGADQSHLLNSNWIEMTLKKGHMEGWREGWSSGTRRTQKQLNSASPSVVQSEGWRATVSSAPVLGCMWLVEGTCKHQSEDMRSLPQFSLLQ